VNYTLSLIVPCFNEAPTIEKCLERVLSFAKAQHFSVEIIVIDDASTDGSFQIIEKLSSQYDKIKILKHEKNKGKGAALRAGFALATGDYIGIQDADLECDPNDYIAMLELVINGSADVIYGSRFLCSATRKKINFWRIFVNKTLTNLSNKFTKLNITDMHTCYKLFRRDVIQKIAPQLKEDRFGFDPEVTAKIAQEQYRVFECAITYNPRTYKEGKKIGWKDGVRALYCIYHYRVR